MYYTRLQKILKTEKINLIFVKNKNSSMVHSKLRISNSEFLLCSSVIAEEKYLFLIVDLLER
ncbi:hypothetical protein T4D_5863 [Trichinella pseudospiralis]|uniref:Uncharacterized protein n=1 Tax=Trichinella pseudospiralis TaxID=6337 RepID=A0A0V1FSL3_TRIPS|nr:hypothetical protein T4D_5863 [Trichinella pseudospiralis]